MLDSADRINSIDKSGMLDVVSRFPDYIEDSLRLVEDTEMDMDASDIRGIVISGMGGSAISGDIVKEWLRDSVDIPIYVNRDYDLPKWVGRDTLTIFLSYSGNTEETISSFKEGVERGSLCVAISSGGKLEEECRKRGIPHIKIPSGFQPRAATAYLLFPTIKILQKIDILDNYIDKEIKETIEISKYISESNRKETEQSECPAESIAKEIKDTLPNIYGWRYYTPIARRWRTQINENSKMIARFDEVPESNHNDIVGWTEKTEVSLISSCVFLRDKKNEPDKIKERYRFMRETFENAGAKVLEVDTLGETLLARMVSLMYIGDYVSVYLAILRGVDPTPVDVISGLKERLSRIQ